MFISKKFFCLGVTYVLRGDIPIVNLEVLNMKRGERRKEKMHTWMGGYKEIGFQFMKNFHSNTLTFFIKE